MSFITAKEKFVLEGDVSLETEDGTDIDEGEILKMLPKEEKVYMVIKPIENRNTSPCTYMK